MAIALDAATATGNHYVDPLNGKTFSHTCTGSDRILFVTGFGAPGSDTVTGITYAGVAMTKIGAQGAGGADNRFAYLWYLIAPATGANNVVITASSGDGTANAVSYTGADQFSQPDASTTNSTAGTPATSLLTSLSSVADNSWFIISCRADAGSNTAGTGATLRVDDTSGHGTYDSNAAVTPAGSYSMTVGSSSSCNLGVVMASFKPVQPIVASTRSPGGGVAYGSSSAMMY